MIANGKYQRCSRTRSRETAEHLNCADNTVRQTFYGWLTKGKEGLFDARRSGRKPVWTAEDINYIEECLEKDERTYNSRQLVEKLKQERSVEISHDRLRKILKKKSGDGKEQESA